MKKSSSLTVRLGFALCEAVVGVLLLINPTGFANTIMMILGGVMILGGILGVVLYFSASPVEASGTHDFAFGVLAIAGGIFCIAKSSWILGLFPILTMLFGVLALAIGIFKLQETLDLARTKASDWRWSAIGAAITLICSAVIFWFPFGSTRVVWLFIGVSLIGVALYDLATILLCKRG